MRVRVRESLKKAMELDPEIMCYLEDAKEHPGSEEEYLESLGLTRNDLKVLEREGVAVRGRTYNGKRDYMEDNQHYTKDFKEGSQLRWILLKTRSLEQT